MLSKYATSALLGVRSARLRSVLTILGIAMGIFLVVTLLAVGKGAQHDVISRITDLGADVITVQSTNQNQTQSQSFSPLTLVNGFTPPTLTVDDLATVKRQPGVAAAAPVSYTLGKLTVGSNSVEPGLEVLTTPQYATVRSLSFASGSFFNDKQASATTPGVVLGQGLKKELFGDGDAIGKRLKYGEKDAAVVGVLAESQSGSQVDRTFIGPSQLADDPDQAGLFSSIIVKVDNVDKVTPVTQSIESGMLAYRSQASFTVTSSKQLLDTSESVLKVLNTLIGILAAISLSMSGVGIMNMMVVSVTDRTKEIGVRKTVGAAASNIFWQFLFEAVLLTVIGGAIGLLMTFAVVYAISHLLLIVPVLSLNLVLLGIALSVLVGVIFGVGPAMRAARKEPIEALQTDHS